MAVYITKCIVLNVLSSCVLAAGPCITAVGSSIGTAVGVSVSVTFVVSFSMGVSVAYVLSYISRRSKESSHKPDSPATVHDVGTNKKMKGVPWRWMQTLHMDHMFHPLCMMRWALIRGGREMLWR